MKPIHAGNTTFFIPGRSSSCKSWVGYFDQLKKELGAENAKMIWLYTWSKEGSVSCTTSASFNRWLQRNDIDVSNAATRAAADFTQIGHNIFGLGKRLTGILSIGLPLGLGAMLLAIMVILIRAGKTMEAGDAAQFLPGGRFITSGLKR